MTENARLKKSIRHFASINQLSYTAALREFDTETGSLACDSVERAPGPWYTAENAWAKERSLRIGERDRCFHELSNTSGRINSRMAHHNTRCGAIGPERFKDHVRSYLYRGPNDNRARTAVLTFAPYLHWDTPTLHEELDSFATEFDVRYRIGFKRDVTYGSQTLPIVFWNPRVIDLS